MTERPLRRGNWSVQELERLRQLLPRRGVGGTATLLRRSPDSVARKALELLRVPPRRGPWTSTDDERLREAWGAVDVRLLGAMLGRPPAEVARRADELRRQLRSGPWTGAELQLLKDLYGTRSDGDLEVVLQRPVADLQAAAAGLCLAKDKRFRARHRGAVGAAQAMPRWRADEVERLRQLYPTTDNLAIARQLGRTVTSVANKANQLGLKKAPDLLAAIGRHNVSARYGRVGEAGA